MNRNILVIAALFAITATDTFSQVQGKFRGGFDVINILQKGHYSINPSINLGYNLQNNMNVGIRCGLANFSGTTIIYNFSGTYTYYFGSGTSPFMPFAGGGLGLNILNSINLGIENKIGGFLTTGFELGKFRLAAEYNLLPSSNVTLETENFNFKNSYLGFTVGFYFGGGNRKKAATVAATAAEREREVQIERERNNLFSYFAPNYVEQEMNKWLQRGEFERTVDWQERISEDNRRAKEAELRKDAEQAFIAERSKDIPVGNITLGTYDADREVFLIRNSVHGEWHAPVPISEAPDFRANWDSLAKTLQWTIRNDRIAFAGYKFTPVEVVVAAEQANDRPARPAAVPRTGTVAQRGKMAVGLNMVYGLYGDLNLFGIGGKFLYNITEPVRLAGEFTYFFPKEVDESIIGVVTLTKTSSWYASVNGHYMFPAANRIAIYPSVGLGIFGSKIDTEIDRSALGLGTQSDSFSDNLFVFSLGGGADLSLTSNLIINGDLRYKIFSGGGRFNFAVGLAYKF